MGDGKRLKCKRSKRMDEIARKDMYTWKYKLKDNKESSMITGLKMLELEKSKPNVIDFIDDFKLNLYTGKYMFSLLLVS